MAEKEDKDMSPDERLAWLRERGVQVETAEERRAGMVAKALREAEEAALGEDEEFSYVLVPADSSKHLEEFKFKTKATGGDVLLEHLKPAFANSGKTVDISLLQKQAENSLLGSANAPATVSDEALRKVASQASVETFALVHPRPSNLFHAVNIYLDEVGMLKRLPLNARASRYAELAGFHPVPQFYGDVFLGRVLHFRLGSGPAILKNVPFLLGVDTALDAPWLHAATTENLEHQMEMNHITGRNETQPSVAGSDGKAKQEEGFRWTQTEQELEVSVPLPDNFNKKDLQVKFRPQSLQVVYVKEDLASIHIFERVDVDSCTWTIERGSTPPQLVITMEKLEEALWPRIID